MAEKPQSLLLPIMSAAVFGGLARLVIRKYQADRQADRQAVRTAREDLSRRVSEAVRKPRR